MGKRKKQPTNVTPDFRVARGVDGGGAELNPRHGHPPSKNPPLLAVSLILFGLWLMFLVATALFG
jgi:hypothetical protein